MYCTEKVSYVLTTHASPAGPSWRYMWRIFTKGAIVPKHKRIAQPFTEQKCHSVFCCNSACLQRRHRAFQCIGVVQIVVDNE